MMSCVASERMVSVPFASTTGTIVQKTPIGVKYMIVPMIFRQISFSESIKSRNGLEKSRRGFLTIKEWFAFFSDGDQGKTDDHCEYENLEHISLGKSLDRV